MTSHASALVADDNADSAITLSIVLELLGYTVRVVHNGRDAVAFAEEEEPRIIFLDLGMPEMDGWESCRRIRSMTWARRPRIFAMTGFGTPDAQERSVEAGFDEHCLKPLHLDTVQRLVANVAD